MRTLVRLVVKTFIQLTEYHIHEIDDNALNLITWIICQHLFYGSFEMQDTLSGKLGIDSAHQTLSRCNAGSLMHWYALLLKVAHGKT